jgi:hypothetical protein
MQLLSSSNRTIHLDTPEKVIELTLTPEDAVVLIGSLLRSERRYLAKARNAPDHLTATAHRSSARQALAIADRVTELCEEGI